MTKYTQQAQPKQDDSNPAAGMMGSMTWMMTLMFVWFALQVPAGLSLYWVVSNSFALAQQLYVNRQTHKWESQLQLDDVKAAAGKSASADIEDVEFKEAAAKSPAAPAKSTQAKRKRRRKR